MGDFADYKYMSRIMQTESGKQYMNDLRDSIIGKQISDVLFINNTHNISMTISFTDGTKLQCSHPDFNIDSFRFAEDSVISNIRKEERELYLQEYPDRRQYETS